MVSPGSMLSSHDETTGAWLRRVGIALITAAAIWWIAVRFIGEVDSLEVALLMNWHVLAMPLGLYLLFRGKRFAAKAQSASVIADPRPPVVFLRSFSTDATTLGRVALGVLNPMAAATQFVTFEEQLADAMRPLGPLVALGRPEETLPLPGAARYYESDATWQDRVMKLLRRGRLVVLVPGASEGLVWEIRTVFATVEPERVLVLFEGGSRSAWASFWRIFTDSTGREPPGQKALRRGWCVTFGEDWTPRVQPRRRAPWLRGTVSRPKLNLLHYNLEPIFRAHGVRWEPYPISALKALVFGVGALVLVLMVALVLLAVLG